MNQDDGNIWHDFWPHSDRTSLHHGCTARGLPPCALWLFQCASPIHPWLHTWRLLHPQGHSGFCQLWCHEERQSLLWGVSDSQNSTYAVMHMCMQETKITSFQNPEKFDPDRFLTPDGQFMGPNERVSLFGVGRRKCVAERLAFSMTFLFIVSIIQSFSLHEVLSLLSVTNFLSIQYLTVLVKFLAPWWPIWSRRLHYGGSTGISKTCQDRDEAKVLMMTLMEDPKIAFVCRA